MKLETHEEQIGEAYLEPSETSAMDFFCENS